MNRYNSSSFYVCEDFTSFTSLVINDKLLCVTVEITSEDITNTDRGNRSGLGWVVRSHETREMSPPSC